MISFKQFLLESGNNYLYHGTSFDYFEDIIKHNILAAKTIHQSSQFAGKRFDKHRPKLTISLSNETISGVSLTRTLKIAQRFGNVIFVLDKTKLIQNYKIKPISWYSTTPQTITSKQIGARSWLSRGFDFGKGERTDFISHNTTEDEEFVLGSIKNLDRYIVKIVVDPICYQMIERYSNKSKFLNLYNHKKIEKSKISWEDN